MSAAGIVAESAALWRSVRGASLLLVGAFARVDADAAVEGVRRHLVPILPRAADTDTGGGEQPAASRLGFTVNPNPRGVHPNTAGSGLGFTSNPNPSLTRSQAGWSRERERWGGAAPSGWLADGAAGPLDRREVLRAWEPLLYKPTYFPRPLANNLCLAPALAATLDQCGGG